MQKLSWILGASLLGLTMAACAGGSDAASGDEDDINGAACAPITTLTCASGFEQSEAGCLQSRVAGATPLGRCVNVDVKKLAGKWGDLQDANAAGLSEYSYEFSADGTYTAQGGCRPAAVVGGTACHAITRSTGKWVIAKSGPQLGAPGGAPELQLTDSFGQKSTLFYTVAGSKLGLSSTYRGAVSNFVKGS